MWFQFSAKSCETLSEMAQWLYSLGEDPNPTTMVSAGWVGPPFLLRRTWWMPFRTQKLPKTGRHARCRRWMEPGQHQFLCHICIHRSIYSSSYPYQTVCLQVYVCSLLRENDGFYSVKATPNTRCYAQKNILAALRTEERPGIEHEAGSSWPTKDGNIMRSNRSFYPPQTSTFAWSSRCIVY